MGRRVDRDREFYDHCDRLGLLVWQEFSQSSSGIESVPSDDPGFVATLAADAREIVPRLRHRPSLAIWGGGNELDGDDSTPALAALRAVVHELDPGRAWLASSPSPDDRDLHGPWEHQGLRKHYEHYDSRVCELHSEFGVEGMTNREAHEALIPEGERWPADRTNPVYEHLGAWWNNVPFVQEAFGGRIDDLETMRRASQWLQYDGLRYAVEANLRRGAGTIPWQLNESYPNAWCTAAVDYHGLPKPAYWGVRRAYAGAPSASFATCAWGGDEEVRARVWGDATARIVELDGGVVVEAEGEIAVPVAAIAGDVFLLDLEGAQPLRDDDDREPRAAARPSAGAGRAARWGAEPPCRPGRHRRPRRRRRRPSPRREQGRRLRRRRRRDGMFEASALAPDGSPVPGFRFDGALTVTYEGTEPVDAGIRVAVELQATDEPRWLVPGVFYGENRPEGCRRLYPRFTPGRVDVARMESDSWSFRADRCATPAVFGPGGGLLTAEESPLGQAGVGFAQRDGAAVIWLDFPFREEPLRYDGSETPAPPDVRTHRWQPGEQVELAFEVLDHDDHARVLRELCVDSTQAAGESAAWVLGRAGRRARRLGSLALALPPRAATAARDRCVRPRRDRRDRRP